MSKAAVTEVEMINESIANAWSSYYIGLSQQLDDCSNEFNGCDNCPAQHKCVRLWGGISSIKKSLDISDFKNYSKQIAELRESKKNLNTIPERTLRLSRI